MNPGEFWNDGPIKSLDPCMPDVAVPPRLVVNPPPPPVGAPPPKNEADLKPAPKPARPPAIAPPTPPPDSPNLVPV